MTVPVSASADPLPFRQVLLKVASRCNLACDYCYVYEFEDEGWRQRPRLMSDETLRAVAQRIDEHARTHQPAVIQVILHGGEPLLAGPEYLDRAASLLRAAETGETRIALGIQTNGVLLDEHFLSVFLRHKIQVGISLDGTEQAHDRHRRFPDGRGSHSRAQRGLDLLTTPRYRSLFNGLLGVIDLSVDPVDFYEAMIEHHPPLIDLLLPHGTWKTPPPGLVPGSSATPYADWLIAVFERWYSAPQRETGIRFFESIMTLLLGGDSGSESLGLAPIDLITVETDGTIEQVDSLKVAGSGAAATGLNVLDHSFDAASQHPGIAARRLGLDALATTCQKCPIVSVCGGGHYTHRYRQGSGFQNPSIYCPDLYRLICHIRERMRADMDTLRKPSAPRPRLSAAGPC